MFRREVRVTEAGYVEGNRLKVLKGEGFAKSYFQEMRRISFQHLVRQNSCSRDFAKSLLFCNVCHTLLRETAIDLLLVVCIAGIICKQRHRKLSTEST